MQVHLHSIGGAVLSLSSGLLQFVSSANLVTPDSTGSSATSDNGLAQLQALANQQQSTAKSQTSTSSSSSARLADDTYTPSTQSLTLLSSSASSKAPSSSTVSSASSSQGSQSDTVTLASLIKNQTISGSLTVRQILMTAMQSNSSGDPEATAWTDLTDKVNTGDYSGAQTALADYSTALDNSHISMWADVSPIKSAITALGSALQAGNTSDVQTAFTALTDIAPTSNYGLVIPTITGDIESEAGQMQWAAANMADSLQKLGYTATNAAAEANAWMLGYAADSLTIHVTTLGEPSDEVSNHSDVDRSIASLAKAAAQSTDKNMLSNILTGMSQANSVSAMETTLTQLASQYGSGSQSASTDSAVNSSTISVYA
jgi:hypothetical protein